jgi:hypothetical protein
MDQSKQKQMQTKENLKTHKINKQTLKYIFSSNNLIFRYNCFCWDSIQPNEAFASSAIAF